MPMRSLLEQAFADAGLEFPANVIETDSTFVTTVLLEAYADLIAVLPNSVVDYMRTRQLVHTLPVPLRRHAEPYGIVMRSGTLVNAVMARFSEACMRASNAYPAPQCQR